jgi:hypothetical protein
MLPPHARSFNDGGGSGQKPISAWSLGKRVPLTCSTWTPRNGGNDTLDDLLTLYGKLPETIEVLTGGGGRHLYFQHSPGVKSGPGKLGAGLDVKADGGYVIAPTSRHISGQPYEFEASSLPTQLNPAPIPGWLRDLLVIPKERRNGQPEPEAAIPSGQRNSTLSSMAGVMRRMGASGEEIYAALALMNQRRCNPPLSEAEVRQIATSIGRYAPASSGAPTPVILKPMTGLELKRTTFAPLHWAIPGLVLEGLNILAGRPKEGKSFMALDFCLAIPCGGYALGTIRVEAGEVLYIGLEDSYRRIKDRVQAKLDGMDDEAAARFYCLTDFPALDQGGVTALDNWLAEHPACRMVVIDVLQAIAPRKPAHLGNAYASDYDMLKELHAMVLRRQVPTILVTHTGKARYEDVLSEVMGTTGLTGKVDTIMVLVQGIQGQWALHVTGRDVAKQELAVRFAPEIGTWSLLGDATTFNLTQEQQDIIAVFQQENRPLLPYVVANELNKKPGTIRVALLRMAQKGLLLKLGDDRYTLPPPPPPRERDPGEEG